jgi:glycosyltransferase involved in cell wall biosynthesis
MEQCRRAATATLCCVLDAGESLGRFSVAARRRSDTVLVTHGPILLVTPRWVRDGGVATHVMSSATALAAQGVTVHVVAATVDTGASVPGVTVHCSPHLLARSHSSAEKLDDVLRVHPSIVHLHQLDDPELVAHMRPIAPVAISMHGYSACTSGVHYFQPGQECGRAHGVGCIPNLIARGCAHTHDPRGWPSSYMRADRAVRALRLSDLAISYSSAVDRHLAANGVGPRRVLPLLATIAPRVGAGHETRRRVVFAGRVVATKGVGVLIRSAREVDAEFVICGDGWQLEAMRRLATRLGVAHRVHFRGWLDGESLAQELADASVVVMPSLWPEPFGLVGIEALSAGRPVVASATGGIEDWLLDGVNGLTVAPGDVTALARTLSVLLDDPARQTAMGNAGREMVADRFSRERHVAALLEAYGAARAEWESRRSEGAQQEGESLDAAEPWPV